MRTYKSVWWSIKVSADWFDEEEPESVAFWREYGVGALQISAYKNDDRAMQDDDLYEFSNGDYPEGLLPQFVRCGEFVGIGLEYSADNNFWLIRWLRNESLLLYVTYNSDPRDFTLEIDDVNRMLDTLRPE